MAANLATQQVPVGLVLSEIVTEIPRPREPVPES